MAGNVIEVVVKTTDQTKAGMESAGKSATSLKERLGEVAGTAAGFLAGNAIASGISGFKNLMSGAVESASDLNESVNAVQMIFGKSSGSILDWGKKNAESFGLSQQAFNEMATPMGAMLKNAGLNMQDTSKWTIDLTKRASDMVNTRAMSHDGDPRLARHVSNAVLKDDSRGVRLAKDRTMSKRKIDLAVCMVMALDRAAHYEAPAPQAAPMFYA